MVTGIGDVEVAGCIQRNALGVVELGRNGWAPIPTKTGGAVPSDGTDHAADRHLADSMVNFIGDVKISSRIQGNSAGAIELGRSGQTPVSAETLSAVAGDATYHAAGRHSPDAR